MNYLFPIVDSLSDVLESLENHQGAFIKAPQYVSKGKEAFENATRVFDTQKLEDLDEKTMFPTKLKFLGDVERQVIQQYITYSISKPATRDIQLMNSITNLAYHSRYLMNDILVAANSRYKWSGKIYTDVCDQIEWTINIVRYPFTQGKAEKTLFPAHKDCGLLAIYPFIDGDGLEVYLPSQKWQWLQVPEGCAFCYAGDIFTRLAGNIPSLLHRVRQPTNEAGSRTSIIFYADPHREMILPDGQKVGDIIDFKLKKIGQIS